MKKKHFKWYIPNTHVSAFIKKCNMYDLFNSIKNQRLVTLIEQTF